MPKKNQNTIPTYVIIFVQLCEVMDKVSTRQYLQHSLFRCLKGEDQILHLKREVALFALRGPKYKPTTQSPATDIATTVRLLKLLEQFKQELAAIHIEAGKLVTVEVPIPKCDDPSVTSLLHLVWTDKYEEQVRSVMNVEAGLIPVLQLFLDKQRKVLAVPYITLCAAAAAAAAADAAAITTTTTTTISAAAAAATVAATVAVAVAVAVL
jgi:hypothetical protein